MRCKKSKCRVNLSPQNVITVEMSTGSFGLQYNDIHELSDVYSYLYTTLPGWRTV